MIAHSEKHTKKRLIILSLCVHACLIVFLFWGEHIQKRSFAELLLIPHPSSSQQKQPLQPASLNQQIVPASSQQASKKPTQQQQAQPQKQALDQRPFTVPVPVMFYGNQVMLNKPTPIKGDKDGKSAFDHAPSALPMPKAATVGQTTEPVIPEQQHPSHSTVTPESTRDKKEVTKGNQLQDKPLTEKKEPLSTASTAQQQSSFSTPTAFAVIEEKTAEVVPVPSTEQSEPVREEPLLQKKIVDSLEKKSAIAPGTDQGSGKEAQAPLTLAALFKNSATDLQQFAQQGFSSFKKAGSEDGDEYGSGKQITIREGDMKYYTLWSKFLNHLNQVARFNHRGKEHLVLGWLQSEQIRYIMQCAITVDRQGKLLDVEIVHSSGCRGFDELCLSDIKAAVPYPPLPESLGKKIVRFEVSVHP